MNTKENQLVLVDGSGYIFRAYYALPPMFRSDGLPVNAVFGFTNMLLKLIEDIQDEKGGNVSIAVIFDAARKTFRNDIYSEYKANRDEPPEDLKPQFDLIKKVPSAFNLEAMELLGFEADDLIASYAKKAKEQGRNVTIVSSDKDLMQLLEKGISIIDPLKRKEITTKDVLEKFGVIPEKVVEVQSLAGDSSDNIPGVPGIGPKIAAQLITEFGNVENLIENVEKIPQEKRRESIILHKEMLIISKKLVTLKNDVDLPLEIEKLNFKPLQVEKLIRFLDEMEFNRIKSSVINKFGQKDYSNPEIEDKQKKPNQRSEYYIPRREKVNKDLYELITNTRDLENWVEKINKDGIVSIDCETTSLNPVDADIVGFSMSLENSLACYIPLNHSGLNVQIKLKDFLSLIREVLEDSSILKIGQNIKYDYIILKNLGIEIVNMDDTMLMSYVLRTGQRGHGLDELAADYLSYETTKFSEITSIKKKKIPFSEVDIEIAKNYAAEDADVTFRLWEILKIFLIKNNLFDFYFFVERPLIEVIANMEINGCMIDNIQLKKLSSEFSKKIGFIENNIFEFCGEKFNVASPKQLGEILFVKLGLPFGKRGKSGNFQTDVKILEKLKSENHEIASQILNWRQFSKLRSTYCEGLLSRENDKTKRIHTSFGMASTLTGRLSSNDPNLQNIPIKTSEGREIRKVFIAKKESNIVSIDYSQIELRILAHVANIKSLISAFENDSDIHTVTAMEVFQLSKENVTEEFRRKAKIINFGIIYGISPYGLAVQLEIPNKEAKEYIDKYYSKYPGIRNYMEKTIEECRSNGFVKTPFGRRIFIPFINDKVFTRRNFAERSAINAPIQGGAADMIKIAMPRVHQFLENKRLRTKILLQVHDELLFESPIDEVDTIKKNIPSIMTESHEKLNSLNVPIKVDVGVGNSWADAH
ncbi:MAG: DNA polymerase I [Pseudomonadota bacterium]|nr:DNA polymerase I [Pseudomonadota bacterium]